MDIVDMQFHLGPGGTDLALAKMDALGIAACVIDEFWFGDRFGFPGYKLGSGFFRTTLPSLELAATLHPNRFTGVLRVDRRDPEVAHVIRLAAQAPYVRAIRLVTPAFEREEGSAFEEGAFAPVFAAACDSGLPVCVTAPLQLEATAAYARQFRDVKIIVDQCGLLSDGARRYLGLEPSPEDRLLAFDKVLSLSSHPNIGLKWVHAHDIFELSPFPGEELRPILRRAINAFGADRVMWGSDASVAHTGATWAEMLFGLRINADLTPQELTALVGGTARNWLNWPMPVEAA